MLQPRCLEKQRPWELLPRAGEGFAWRGRWPAGALGAAEAEAAEADQTERTDQDHAEGGGLGDSEGEMMTMGLTAAGNAAGGSFSGRW